MRQGYLKLVTSQNLTLTSCCARNSNNTKIQVSVGDHVCGSIEFVQNKQWYKLDCKGQAGSSVTVKKETGFLQFCEVIVQAAED